MATIDVKDAANVTQTLERPLAPGQAAMAASRPVVIASNQSAVPISGTVTANAGTGTMTVSGAVTNAGTFVTQENGAALTALQLIDDIVVAQGTALGATKNSLIGGSVTTSAPSYTNGQISPFSMDTSGNQRVTINPAQLGSLVNNSVPTVSGGFQYETVPISQTDQIMGATGAVGDYLEAVICVVATPATSQVQIKDGNGTAITILPNAVGAGVGNYYIPLGLRCINATTPGWKITTAAGVTAIGTGVFT